MFCYNGYNFFAENLGNFSGNYLEIGVFNGDSLGVNKVTKITRLQEGLCGDHVTAVFLNGGEHACD